MKKKATHNRRALHVDTSHERQLMLSIPFLFSSRSVRVFACMSRHQLVAASQYSCTMQQRLQIFSVGITRIWGSSVLCLEDRKTIRYTTQHSTYSLLPPATLQRREDILDDLLCGMARLAFYFFTGALQFLFFFIYPIRPSKKKKKKHGSCL